MVNHLTNLRLFFIKYSKNKLESEKIGSAVKVIIISSFTPITVLNKYNSSYFFSMLAEMISNSALHAEV